VLREYEDTFELHYIIIYDGDRQYEDTISVHRLFGPKCMPVNLTVAQPDLRAPAPLLCNVLPRARSDSRHILKKPADPVLL